MLANNNNMIIEQDSDKTNDNSAKLLKNTSILAIGIICTKILTFVLIPIFTNWLSEEEYGMFDLYNTYVALLIPLSTLACGEAVFRFLIDSPEQQKKKEILSTSTIIVVVGLTICSIILNFVINEPLLVKRAIIAYVIAEVLNSFLLCYIRSERRIIFYAQINIYALAFIGVFVTIFVYKMQLGLAGILLGYAAAYGLCDILILVVTPLLKYVRIQFFSKITAKEILVYSLPLIPNTIGWWIMNVSDRTIIKWILGGTILGIYAIACKIPSLCSSLYSVFQLSWLQSVSETINDEGKEAFYNQVLNTLVCTTVSIGIGVLSLNFILFDYIFASKYSEAYWQSGLLVPAVVLSSVSAYLGGIFIGQKKSKRNGITTAISATVNVLSHLALIHFIGIFAASTSTLIGYSSLVLIRWGIVNKTIKLAINKRTLVIIGAFLYFIAIQYYRIHWLEWFNILFASVLFLVINKNFFNILYNKLFRTSPSI